MKLFLVDDNELVRNSLGGLLRDLYPELHISTFASCEAALAGAEPEVQFILLDFHLYNKINTSETNDPPKLEAWDCLFAMRQRFPSTRIILISAEPSQEMYAKARALGAYAFIEKSVRPAVMLKEIREALDGDV